MRKNKTHSLLRGFPKRNKINTIKRKPFLINCFQHLILLLLIGFFGGSDGHAQTTYYGQNTGTHGIYNSFFGAWAGNVGGASTPADGNTFIGYAAGYLNTGNDNVMLGRLSGYKNYSGSGNTFIGKGSGYENDGSGNVFIGKGAGAYYSGSNKLIINNSPYYPLITGDFNANKVGINTFNFPTSLGGKDISSYSLFVEGGILTKEFRIRTSWADYVFDKGYVLPSLDELEDYIEKHKHLPNVPSTEQVSAEGLDVGEISRIQQEKIEELALYAIELNKRLKTQQFEMNNQQIILKAQQQEINQLKTITHEKE